MKNGEKLDNNEIKKYIFSFKYTGNYKPSENLVDSIIQQFWFHDFYNSLLGDEKFLNYLTSYLNQTRPHTFNRFSFYRFFFNHISSENISKGLYQLGIAFESLQTDAIDPTQYKAMLSRLNLPVEKFGVTALSKLHLVSLTKRDGKDLVIWTHHALTEFLVADYLTTLSDYLSQLEELAVLNQEGVVALKPSWQGVLRFLLESPVRSKILDWLISFLTEHPDNIDDNLAELIIYVTQNPSPTIKSRIFNLIYNTYFEKLIWLPVWARKDLAKYVDQASYKRIKHDLKKWPEKVETYVKRGNVVGIVEGLLESKSNLIIAQENVYWKNKLVSFCLDPQDDGNGVLQRHSLNALAHYHDDSLIPLLGKKCYDETTDSMVKDAFLRFCIDSAANSPHTIDYLIRGIHGSTSIYARHGLYELKTKKAIKYFLSQIVDNSSFLTSFLDRERIYDKDDRDKLLFATIDSLADSKIITLLKNIIRNIFALKDFYHHDNSPVISAIAHIISTRDSNYLFEVLKEIQQAGTDEQVRHRFFDYYNYIALLLTPANLTHYLQTMASFPAIVKDRLDMPIYRARQFNGEVGERLYAKAKKLGIVQDQQVIDDSPFGKRKTQTYEIFKAHLYPSPGKYIPDVFEMFLHNREYLESVWTKEDKKRLIELAIDEGIKKIDPRDIKVTFVDGNSSKFNWSSVAAYYGDILEIVKIFSRDELTKYRQNIINFIPYAFSDDSSRILEIITELTDDELKDVNKVMLDKSQDKRYLIPSTYIYMVGKYKQGGSKIPSAEIVLKSFVEDERISYFDQREALEKLQYFLTKDDSGSKKWLENLFKKYISIDDKQILAHIANELLITVYKDESSIDWRFKEIKKPLPHIPPAPMEVHTVDPIEHELHDMEFAKPLTNLDDEKYLPKFIELLDYSFEVQKKYDSKEYWEYINYLWRIVIRFIENLKWNRSFTPLNSVQSWINSHPRLTNINWLSQMTKDLKSRLIYEFSLPNNPCGKTMSWPLQTIRPP